MPVATGPRPASAARADSAGADGDGTVVPPDLTARIDARLPQTQCRRCGHDGCRPYAAAIATGHAPIDRCPPGGDATIRSLATLLGIPIVPLDPTRGPTPPRRVARIDVRACIGCTKCILACPVDAIVGAPRHQHHVLPDRCTGCDLCLPPCPTDCIEMTPLATPWSTSDATRARRADRAHRRRRAGALPATPAATPATAPATGAAGGSARDPLAVLADADRKAQRLAAIRRRVGRAAP